MQSAVKGVGCLDNVCENLKKYNNERDVDTFAEICDHTGCLIGNISYDYRSPLPIPEKTASAMRRLKENLDALHILCTSNIVYSASDYVKSLSESPVLKKEVQL
jgi:pyruvate formate-lyase activating enzyme-like uncharacterized protein